MKKREWNEALDHLDPDIIENYVEQRDRLRSKRRREKTLLRTAAVAACLAVVVGAVMIAPMLQEDEPIVIPRPDETETIMEVPTEEIVPTCSPTGSQTEFPTEDIVPSDSEFDEPTEDIVPSDSEFDEPTEDIVPSDSEFDESTEDIVPTGSPTESPTEEIVTDPPILEDPTEEIGTGAVVGDNETGSTAPDYTDESESETIELPPVPSWDDANYSANDIADMIAGLPTESLVTNAYVEIYTPNPDYFNIGTIPDAEYLGIYEYVREGVPLDEENFKDFINGCIGKLTGALGVHQFAVTDSQIIKNDDKLLLYKDTEEYSIWFSQYETRNTVMLSNSNLNSNRQISLSGEIIQIDQRLSDEEIISSLASIKEKLFEIFNVSFTDAKVVRRFNNYSTNGANFIDVLFYNEEDVQLNYSLGGNIYDYLEISFDNSKNYSGDIVSDSILSVASVSYRQSRGEHNKYSLISNERMISLEEAEALLYNGYVFAGHTCPLCMAEQDKISFVGYDYVDVRYVFGVDQTTYETKMGVPFYVFYKKIGVAQNGNYIYARTMVPAIEVKGLKEYFESNAKYH